MTAMAMEGRASADLGERLFGVRAVGISSMTASQAIPVVAVVLCLALIISEWLSYSPSAAAVGILVLNGAVSALVLVGMQRGWLSDRATRTILVTIATLVLAHFVPAATVVGIAVGAAVLLQYRRPEARVMAESLPSAPPAPATNTAMPISGPTLRPEFVSVVSHELRSPLNVIIGYGELLHDQTFGPLNSEQEDALQRIGENATLLLDRLNSVLDYSRVQAGALEIGVQEVAVESVLASVADNARPLAYQQEKAVDFVVHDAAGAPPLRTDPEKLTAALNHVVSNAFKFTEAGRVRLSAKQHGDGVEFEVSDTGLGIPPDKLANVFEPFSKLNGKGKKGFRDFGLGLYLARGYVERLGGRISVESELGEGSTFRLWVPTQADS